MTSKKVSLPIKQVPAWSKHANVCLYFHPHGTPETKQIPLSNWVFVVNPYEESIASNFEPYSTNNYVVYDFSNGEYRGAGASHAKTFVDLINSYEKFNTSDSEGVYTYKCTFTDDSITELKKNIKTEYKNSIKNLDKRILTEVLMEEALNGKKTLVPHRKRTTKKQPLVCVNFRKML